MRAMAIAFFVLTLVGLWMGNWAVASLSFGWLLLLACAKKVFEEQDKAFYNDPKHARKEPDTLEMLEREGCECSAPVFPDRFSKSDSET